MKTSEAFWNLGSLDELFRMVALRAHRNRHMTYGLTRKETSPTRTNAVIPNIVARGAIRNTLKSGAIRCVAALYSPCTFAETSVGTKQTNEIILILTRTPNEEGHTLAQSSLSFLKDEGGTTAFRLSRT